MKFRVWDTDSIKSELGEMYYEFDHGSLLSQIFFHKFVKKFDSDYASFKIIERNIDRFIFMSSTGAVDVNGKEIYEGDILLYHGDETPRVVEYIEYDTAPDELIFSKFPHFTCKIKLSDGSCVYNSQTLSYPELCRVIGNIHENPELLEDSSEGR